MEIKKKIDQLIELHKEEPYLKYYLKCSVGDFKKLQRLLSEEYKIKDDWGDKGLWRHNGTIGEPTRTGVVKFSNFEIKVTCPTNYKGEFELKILT